jgi:DNA-binding NarL/FixJ family response regulator
VNSFAQEVGVGANTEVVDDEFRRVLVVDDHLLLAETVSSALEKAGEFDVTCVRTADEALAMIDAYGRFDVVLLDYDLPGSRGLEALREIVARNGSGVALFSGVAGSTIALQAIEAGASGFVPKTLPLKVLVHALRFIAAGETYLPSSLIRSGPGQREGNSGLTPREMKVLAMLSQGYQNKEIALAVGVPETTTKNDVRALCKKLNARNRTDAVVAARRVGLV